jgi:hypothetical protein
MRMPILALMALLAAGCAPSPAPVIPVITPRAYTVPEQKEIARGHQWLENGKFCELTAEGLRQVSFPMAFVVFEDWLRMRAAIKAAQ